MKIIFLGLSNKIDMLPFDERTNSGKVIKKVIDNLNDECYKMNLVPYAPIDSNKKLRYPNSKELNEGIESLKKELLRIKPDLIISFGNIVNNEIDELDLNIKVLKYNHPSYMYVYKRKDLDDYINNIISDINDFKITNY